MTNYIGTIDQDENGELLLIFPPEMLEELDWHINDVLEWSDNKDGTFYVKRIEK